MSKFERVDEKLNSLLKRQHVEKRFFFTIEISFHRLVPGLVNSQMTEFVKHW